MPILFVGKRMRFFYTQGAINSRLLLKYQLDFISLLQGTYIISEKVFSSLPKAEIDIINQITQLFSCRIV